MANPQSDICWSWGHVTRMRVIMGSSTVTLPLGTFRGRE